MCVQVLINVFSYISKAEINAKCLPQFSVLYVLRQYCLMNQMLTDSALLAVPASPECLRYHRCS